MWRRLSLTNIDFKLVPKKSPRNWASNGTQECDLGTNAYRVRSFFCSNSLNFTTIVEVSSFHQCGVRHDRAEYFPRLDLDEPRMNQPINLNKIDRISYKEWSCHNRVAQNMPINNTANKRRTKLSNPHQLTCCYIESPRKGLRILLWEVRWPAGSPKQFF